MDKINIQNINISQEINIDDFNLVHLLVFNLTNFLCFIVNFYIWDY